MLTINPVNPRLFAAMTAPVAVAQTTPGNDNSFFNSMKEALSQVNTLQVEASSNAKQLALGLQDYLHSPIIAYEKANLALQLTVEIRNRLIETYQEIMRMQM